jgi:putative salt-induced outer membrane protein YdiY
MRRSVVRVPEDQANVELVAPRQITLESTSVANETSAAPALTQTAPAGAAEPFQGAKSGNWEKQVEFGLMAQNGRRHYSNYSVLLDVVRRLNEQDEIRFLFNRYYGKSDGTIATDSTLASANYKKGISEDFFVNTTASFESDALKGLDHDASQGIGIGMNLMNREKVTLKMGAGAGVRHREFSGESANWNALVDAFQTLNFSINDRLTFKQRVAVNAVPDLPDDFQVKFRAALVSSITEALDMSVRYEFEYDGSINHDIRNIERLVTSIGYAF